MPLIDECRRAAPRMEWFSPTGGPKPPVGDSQAIVRASLTEAGSFLDEAATDGTLLLLVNDPDRATDTRSVLDALAPALERLSSRLAVTALVAGGSHPVPAVDVRNAFEAKVFGPHAARLARIVWHDARYAGELADVAGVVP